MITPERLILAPVLLPLGTAALMLLAGERRRGLKAFVNVVSTALGLVLSIMLLAAVAERDGAAAIGVYLPGNWPVPFGIVLVADRLSALMVVLASCVGLAGVLSSLARWQHAGAYFHAMVQLQLMGLAGAFLTADLFNLFVFFEVMLAASYGLLLHGSGSERVRAGLHYIAINLVASLLFLIGVAVIYGVTGTLNMADIARKLADVPASDRGLLHAGAALLGIAFLTKAAAWPLGAWLPPAYGAASPPAAAVLAILTKVGVYALLRLWTLCFPADAGASAGFGGEVLVWSGLVTLAIGAVGMLASQRLSRLAAFSVIASSGTLVATIGFDAPALGAGALVYLASSTLAGSALFLLVELLERAREVETGPAQLDDGDEALPAFPEAEFHPDANLDDDEEALFGRAIPAALAFLGVTFAICALVTSGLPPLSGFVGKVAMMTALLELRTVAAWTLFALLLVSGLFAAMSLMRVGIRHFWVAEDRPAPRLRVIETLPIAALLSAAIGIAIEADTVLVYTRAAADALHSPVRYVDAVMSARPVVPAPGVPR